MTVAELKAFLADKADDEQVVLRVKPLPEIVVFAEVANVRADGSIQISGDENL